MTRIVGKVLIIEPEKDDVCEYCGEVKELRPYGKDGANICFDCAMKPENREETDKNFKTLYLDRI
jgi:hypothetical protein